MTASPLAPALGTDQELPELSAVPWRQRVEERSLVRTGRLWTASTVAQTLPFIAVALALTAVDWVMAPIALIAIAYGWILSELYASRGAGVLRRRPPAGAGAERIALGLLGDLVGDRARDLHRRTGLLLERGGFGVWLLAEAGAVLVRPGGRRVHCYCVGVPDPSLPAGDRTAHLLLALRTDEAGFATVANVAFAGAPWRLRRRIPPAAREALDAAVQRAARPEGL